MKAVREPSVMAAVLSPDGEAADAAITDTELEDLFGTLEATQEAQQVTSGEKVPGGAVLAVLGAPVARVDDLLPIPQDDLRSRPVAMPSETTYRLVKGLVGGNKAIDDGILDTLTPAGALPRRDWLRLTEEELTEVRQVAQAEAQSQKLNFYTCAIRGLDRLIGAPVGQTTTRGLATAVTPNSGSFAPAKPQEQADHSQDEGKFEPGALWRNKTTGDVVTLLKTEGAGFQFSDGQIWIAFQLVMKYEFAGRQQAASA